VARSDTEQADGGTLRFSSALLPVSQGVHADTHRRCELLLGKTNEPPQGRNVGSGLELPPA